MQEIRATGLLKAILIDGSFVTHKQDPEDIDLIFVFPEDFDESAELLPFQYNSLSRKRLRIRYGFDVVVVLENKEEYQKSVQFFSQVRNHTALKKGLLRIQL